LIPVHVCTHALGKVQILVLISHRLQKRALDIPGSMRSELS
jgi:hypothetical protein